MRIITAFLLLLALSSCSTDATDKKPSTLASLQGQWVVINYWARWCKPCIEEIPELNALNAEYPQVTVLGVNYDGVQGEELAQQVADLNVKFELLPEDPAAQLGISRPVVLPTTLIVGPDGKFRRALTGPQTVDSLIDAMGLADVSSME
jgi:thiol-disulfide isomerase/thioredoxin